MEPETPELVESCATCRYWHRKKAQSVNLMAVAPCRRYPVTAVMIVAQRLGARGPEISQGPGTIPTLQPADEWCGEYQLEHRATAYNRPAAGGR